MPGNQHTHVLHGRAVSRRFLQCLWAGALALVALNATFNGLCGWSQGSTGEGALLTALAYGLGELLLLLFAYLVIPSSVGRFAGVFCCFSLLLLSVWASASFMISQQFSADHSGVESLRRDVARLETATGKLDIANREDRGTLQKTNDRLAAARTELRKAEGAGEGSGSTAMYRWVGKTLGYPVEVVSVVVRLLWSFTFALAALSLGSYLHAVRAVPTAEEAGKGAEPVRERPSTPKERPLEEPAPILHFENGRTRHRRNDRGGGKLREDVYQTIRNEVATGALVPTMAALKRAAHGSRQAYEAIDRLVGDGVVHQAANGRYQVIGA